MFTLTIKKTPWQTPYYGNISLEALDLMREARRYGFKPPYPTKEGAADAAKDLYAALDSRIRERVRGANDAEDDRDAKDKRRRWTIGCPDVYEVVAWTPETARELAAADWTRSVVLPDDLEPATAIPEVDAR